MPPDYSSSNLIPRRFVGNQRDHPDIFDAIAADDGFLYWCLPCLVIIHRIPLHSAIIR